MKWGRHVLSGALFLATAAYVWLAVGYKPTPRLFPLAVGIPMLVLTALQTAIECVPRLSTKYAALGTVDAERLAGKANDRVAEDDPRQTRKELATFLWLGLAVGASMLLGMLWGIPLFIFIFLKLRSATRWTVAVGLPLGTLGVMYLLFARVFQIPLYAGLLWE